ncbi:MAG: NAD(P)/FAD-dependent oxidoreductase [archaeon]|nr:MAG: NAD(P)/FAD-dependent oxidoreductase [archaeon]
MKTYDVVIVGAGPAGGQLARELSARGHSILVIDKEMEIGEPVYSTAGTFPTIFEEFKLPLKLGSSGTNFILFKGPKKEVELRYNKPELLTLNFKGLKQFLLREAIKKGAESLIGTRATHPILKGNKIIGVKYTGIGGSGEVYGKVVVDASGPEGVLASQLGLRKKREKFLTIGAEFLMENLNLDRNGKRFDFCIGKYIAPAGYAWIFPTNKNEAKVGVGFGVDHLGKNKKSNPIYYLHKFIKSNNQLKEGQALEFHSGIIYANGGIKKYSLNNFLVIGESACQTSPLFGEGIRHCMWSGRFASEVISNSLKLNNFSQKKLEEYDKKWKKYIGYRWKYSVKIREIASRLSDAELDRIVDAIKDMDPMRFLHSLRTEFTKEEVIKGGLHVCGKRFLRLFQPHKSI